MTKRKRDDVASNVKGLHENESPLKKAKIADHNLSSIPELKSKQIKIRTALHGFCDQIGEIMQAELKTHALQIPKDVIDEILSFSSHKQMQQFWVSTENRLKEFSFMIKAPHSLEEIHNFERKYRDKFNEPSYQIPAELRTSLLLARSIQIPQIFKHNTFDSMRTISGMFETVMFPLDQWDFVHEHKSGYYMVTKWLDVDYCKAYWPSSHRGDGANAGKRMNEWMDFTTETGQKTLCIGSYENDDVSVYIFLNGEDLMFLSWGEEEEIVLEEMRSLKVSDLAQWKEDEIKLDGDAFGANDLLDHVFADVDDPLPSENIIDGQTMSGSQKLIFKSSIEQCCARWNSESEKIADPQEANEFAEQLMLLYEEWKEIHSHCLKNKNKNKNVNKDTYSVESDEDDDDYSDDGASV